MLYIAGVILGGAFLNLYYVLVKGNVPKKSNFSIDFDKVRKTGNADKDKLPESIHILPIATGELPSWGLVAGDLFSDVSKIVFPSFQIVYNDSTMLLEVPYNKRLFDNFSFGKDYYIDNYNIMQQALDEADLIMCTHEHWDHIGGVAQSPNVHELIKKCCLTEEQINGPTLVDSEFPLNAFEDYEPLKYDKYHRLAPGIVLIKAPGHSVGHQFVYVKLKNGKEYLFTGDVVWGSRNFELQRNKPWLASKKRFEDRTKVAHQIRYFVDEFHNNNRQKINMVLTHDPRQHDSYIKKGLLNYGFVLKN